MYDQLPKTNRKCTTNCQKQQKMYDQLPKTNKKCTTNCQELTENVRPTAKN
eukprot:NODE_10526_length_238_cov_25.428571_g9785_i0.p3 GENE.NODE_10526_length_238_cov_25.428571_g9785_i0~~NODE_10526_length_238_cov_25.428571_g9785_i0.p3  ORF type:complete len:51 (+),score=6.61 NODE_10526_length_238_cov_25.428571_g9785_i0:71-223(+)